MLLADVVGVLSENPLFHGAAADHVERHHQEVSPLGPFVALGDHRGQFRHRSSLCVTLQQQVQHGHKVTLTAAEATVQVAGLGLAGVHGTLDETRGLLEAGYKLRGHHVILEGPRSVLLVHTGRQIQDKVALVHLCGQIQQISNVFSHLQFRSLWSRIHRALSQWGLRILA